MVLHPGQNQIKPPPAPNCAVVLAGGMGTRLRAAIPDRPKVLAQVNGRPFLDYVLQYLSSQGIADVILSTGHLAEQVSAFAGKGEPWGLQVQYCYEDKPLGTAGALRQAAHQFALPSFFALNGDTIFLVNLNRLWQLHTACHALATLALHPIPFEEGTVRGCVRLANDGRIAAFEEKPARQPGRATEKTLLANGGIYALHQSALGDIRPGQTASVERQVFPQLANRGHLAGSVHDAYFADIGTPASLKSFEKDIIVGAVPKLPHTDR